VIFKKTSGKLSCPAAKLKNTPDILKVGVGCQDIERRIFIETLAVLFLSESVIVNPCSRLT